eukprot:UN00516
MRVLHLLTLMLVVSLLFSSVSSANAFCTTCCAAYWLCVANSFTWGCASRHRYCRSRCECHQFG